MFKKLENVSALGLRNAILLTGNRVRAKPNDPFASAELSLLLLKNNELAKAAESMEISITLALKEKIPKFSPRPADNADGTWKIDSVDTDRVQEFRKCVECYLCQDVCHVLREHDLHDEFIGPRFLVHIAGLDMHPIDIETRTKQLKEEYGIGYCNITKCCTTVCPENIKITDNAIIPLKERVADDFYDPIKKLMKIFKK